MIPQTPYQETDLSERTGLVRLLVMEMEGVLSDGRVWTMPDQSQGLATYGPDAWALDRWRQTGRRVVVMARAGLAAAEAFCQLNGLTFRVHQGDKASTLNAILFENQMTPQDLCYLGASLEDLPAMMIAGVAGAPGDAPQWVRGGAHVVTQAPGGRGAVAEVVDLLLDQPGPEAG